MIKNWLGWESFQLIKIFTKREKGKPKIAKGVFLYLSYKFRLHHNRIVLCLQFKKLHKKGKESTQIYMDKLWKKAREYDDTEHDKALKKAHT